ncbi:MAG: transcriptional activator NhaR [Planctomycetaceae bacterium]
MTEDWLNYHHLLYFWTVAREGSVTKAADKLHLAQPTISGQLRKLEKSLGEKLYDRVGRDIVLTEMGHVVYRYADDIFSLGQELVATVKGRPEGRPVRFVVGVPEVLPKLIAFRLLEPALHLEPPVQLVCREGPMEQLLRQLAAHELDVVFSDFPASSMVRVKAFNHALGKCGIGLFGVPRLCRRFERTPPDSLNEAPFLLPSESTSIRRSVDMWIQESGFQPSIIGEMDDTALLKVFAQAGVGFVPAPLAIRSEIENQYGLRLLLEIPGAVEHFYAITIDRRIRHPAVVAISRTAKQSLFPPSER